MPEIVELDPNSKVSKARMRRIIIHSLNSEYSGYIVGICAWRVQPTILELKSLLVAQETLVKQTADVSLKSEDEALSSHKERSRSRRVVSKQPRKGEP